MTTCIGSPPSDYPPISTLGVSTPPWNSATQRLSNAQVWTGGKPFEFSLSDALKKGPVVLYFYPAAFTQGCTIEAHRFAEATDEFAALDATVIGVSPDKIDTLHKFPVTECRNKFAVASDASGTIMKDYDAVLAEKPKYANRTTYVIEPGGRIVFSFTDLQPDMHVENALLALRRLVAK